MKTFKERFLAGHATQEDIDKDIAAWHADPNTGKSLASYLGLNAREYDTFVAHPRVFWDRLKETKLGFRRG